MQDTMTVTGLAVHFGGVKAVDGVDMELVPGQILGLIGPNGAGKTTLINAITGFQRATAGRVVVRGRDVTGWSCHRLARFGVSRTFQGARVFPDLTTVENIQLGALGRGASRTETKKRAGELLDALDLFPYAHTPAASLPAGIQRRLGLARALACDPTFLLLDEPAAGTNEAETDELVAAIHTARSSHGCAILVIEHDMQVIMGLCDKVQVLENGHTIFSGSYADARTDRKVMTAYLGDEHETNA